MKPDEIIREALERRESLRTLFEQASEKGLLDSTCRIAAEMRLLERHLVNWLQGAGPRPSDPAEAVMAKLLDGDKPRRSSKRGPRHRQP
jgi:hypothetical protein